jgi:hypothetical protein
VFHGSYSKLHTGVEEVVRTGFCGIATKVRPGGLRQCGGGGSLLAGSAGTAPAPGLGAPRQPCP